MKNTITVGLCGLTFNSENKGCSALAYAFTDLLLRAAKHVGVNIIINEISNIKEKDLIINNEALHSINTIEYHFSDLKSRSLVVNALKKCDLIFDFSEGDSFTDIYGEKRLISNSWLKIKSINLRKKLILGPQTYGPFKKFYNRILASYILKKAYKIYSRDNLSTQFVEKISSLSIPTLIDVAFALPYNRYEDNEITEVIKVGINVSGLLWIGGYTNNNQFGLYVDYQEYITSLVNELQKSSLYEIHLIPHVISNSSKSEDDYSACLKVKNLFPNVIIAPRFSLPMEAKNYISKMDIFSGARMHATIAAFSSGVPVIPFSYSRKFEGLYDTLKYPYCINGITTSTNDAVADTIRHIKNYKDLKIAMKTGTQIYLDKLSRFSRELREILQQV